MICPVRGDPWRRSQRAFIVMCQILISMAFNILFYQGDLDACPDADSGLCPNDDDNVSVALTGVSRVENTTDAGGQCECYVEGDCECLPNGLLASFVTAAIAFPVIGLLNLGFGLLRRPLTHDLNVKRGEQYRVLREKQQKEKYAEDQPPRCVRCMMSCVNLWQRLKLCVRVQAGHMTSRSRHGPRARKTGTRVTSERNETSLTARRVPRDRAHPCKRRQLWAAQLKMLKDALQAIVQHVDESNAGSLTFTQLREVLTEMNGGITPPVKVIKAVQDEAAPDDEDPSLRGTGWYSIRRTENTPRLERAVIDWRFRQAQFEHLQTAIERVDTGAPRIGRLRGKQQLRALLSLLNDNVEPSEKELEWFISLNSSHSDKEQAVFDKKTLMSALQEWYPASGAGRRPLVVEMQPVEPGRAGRARRALTAQLDTKTVETEYVVDGFLKDKPADYRISPQELRKLMHRLADGPFGKSKTDELETVEEVLIMADVDGSHSVDTDEIRNALAIWNTLRVNDDEIQAAFAKYACILLSWSCPQ